MPATFMWKPETQILEVTLTGTLDKPDYERFAPELDQLIATHGALRALVVLHDFHGWTMSGLWEDIKLDYRHYDDLQRLAIVGEKRWQEGMAWFCKPFTTAKIRYFEDFELDDARAWLTKEAPKTEQHQHHGEFRE